MAQSWHRLDRRFAVFVMAILLVCPPLTSAAAAIFDIDLTHHHCLSHTGHDAAPDVGRYDVGLSDSDPGDPVWDDHAAKSDPYQCDRCHVAVSAIIAMAAFESGPDAAAPRIAAMALPLPRGSPPPFHPPKA